MSNQNNQSKKQDQPQNRGQNCPTNHKAQQDPESKKQGQPEDRKSDSSRS